MKSILMLALCAMLLTPAQASPECQTPAETEEIGVKQGATRVHLLEGVALSQFHANYSRKFRQDAPDRDRVETWSLPGNPNWLLIAYKNGCALTFLEVDPKVFQSVVNGEKS